MNVPNIVAKVVLWTSSGTMHICSYTSDTSRSVGCVSYIVAYRVLIWKGRDVLFHVVVMYPQVKYGPKLGALFRDTHHGDSLLHHSWHPPSRISIPTDFVSQFGLQSIRTLRQVVCNLFAQVYEINMVVNLMEWGEPRQYPSN